MPVLYKRTFGESRLCYPNGTTLGDETEKGSILFPTQFDAASKAIYKDFEANAKDLAYAKANHLDITKFLKAYIAIARKLKRPYDRQEFGAWQKELIGAGFPAGDATVLLNHLRLMREAGRVGDAVWDPVLWAHENPEDASKNPFNKFMDKLGEAGKTVVLIGGIGLTAYFLLPGLLVRLRRASKKAA